MHNPLESGESDAISKKAPPAPKSPSTSPTVSAKAEEPQLEEVADTKQNNTPMENTVSQRPVYAVTGNQDNNRGGYSDLALASLIFERGGWRGHDGCHHRCHTFDEAQAILQRLNSNEIEDVVREAGRNVGDRVEAAKNGLSERIGDAKSCLSEQVSGAKACLSERLSDTKECLSKHIDGVKGDLKDYRQEARQDFKENRALIREVGKEVCELRVETRAGFVNIENKLRVESLEAQLRNKEDKLSDKAEKIEGLRFKIAKEHDDRRFEKIETLLECRGGRSYGRGGCDDRDRDYDRDRHFDRPNINVSIRDSNQAGVLSDQESKQEDRRERGGRRH